MKEFLIRWKGYSPKFDTWEPESNLSCNNLIQKYISHAGYMQEGVIDDVQNCHEDRADDDDYKGGINDTPTNEKRTSMRITKRPTILKYAPKPKCETCGVSLREGELPDLGMIFCSKACIQEFENHAWI